MHENWHTTYHKEFLPDFLSVTSCRPKSTPSLQHSNQLMKQFLRYGQKQF